MAQYLQVLSSVHAFLSWNGIHHVTSAPYHPATNGFAERSVLTMQ